MKQCPNCKGKGTEPDWVGLEMRCVMVECTRCKGTGTVTPDDVKRPHDTAPRFRDL
jgi:DnaJ-class molecular chaperone